MYDITSRDSFAALEVYWHTFMKYAVPEDIEDYPLLLVGCKSDLSNKRAIPMEEVLEFCSVHRPSMPITYVETSALHGIGVQDVFLFIGESVHDYLVGDENEFNMNDDASSHEHKMESVEIDEDYTGRFVPETSPEFRTAAITTPGETIGIIIIQELS